MIGHILWLNGIECLVLVSLSLELLAERKEESVEELITDLLFGLLDDAVHLFLLGLLLFLEELLVLSLVISLEFAEIFVGDDTLRARAPFELLEVLQFVINSEWLTEDVEETD